MSNCHSLRSIESRSGLKHDADHLAILIERAHIVEECRAFAAALVLGTVAQKVPVQLLDIVFSDGYVGPRMKDRFHEPRIARNFLFVPCGEFLDFEASEHLLDLSVGRLLPSIHRQAPGKVMQQHLKADTLVYCLPLRT